MAKVIGEDPQFWVIQKDDGTTGNWVKPEYGGAPLPAEIQATPGSALADIRRQEQQAAFASEAPGLAGVTDRPEELTRKRPSVAPPGEQWASPNENPLMKPTLGQGNYVPYPDADVVTQQGGVQGLALASTEKSADASGVTPQAQPVTPGTSQGTSTSVGGRTTVTEERRGPTTVGGSGLTYSQIGSGLTESTAAEGDAAQREAEIEAEKNRKIAEQQKYLADEQKRLDEVEKVAEAERKTRLAAKEEQINSAYNKLNDFSVDPGRWWKDKSNGEKATAFISIALAGIGNAFTAASQALAGGAPQQMENPVLGMIDKAIDRDIDAQKSEFQKLGMGLEHSRSMYEVAYRQVGDERKAEELVRIKMRQNVIDQIASITTNAESQAVVQRGRQVQEQLKQKNFKDMSDLNARAAAEEMQRKQLQLSASAQAESRRHNRAMENIAGRPGPSGPDLSVPGVAGASYRNEKLANEHLLKKSAAESFLTALSNYEKKYAEIDKQGGNWSNWLSTNEGQAWVNTAKQDLMNAYSVARGQGVIQPGEAPRYDKMFGPDAGNWTPSAVNQMRGGVAALRNGVETNIDTELRNYTNGYGKEKRKFDPSTGEWFVDQTAVGGQYERKRKDPRGDETVGEMFDQLSEGVSYYSKSNIVLKNPRTGVINVYDQNDPNVKEDQANGRLVPPTRKEHVDYLETEKKRREDEEKRKRDDEAEKRSYRGQRR